MFDKVFFVDYSLITKFTQMRVTKLMLYHEFGIGNS